MNELDLYKFIHDRNIECQWIDGELWIMPFLFQLETFTNLVGECPFDEGGYEVVLFKDYISINISPICEMFDIDPERICPKGDD